MKTEIGKAELRTLGDRLFWDYDYIDENKNIFRARWQGVDSVFWWTTVEFTDRIRVLETNGIRHVFEIDHRTNKVYLLTTPSEMPEDVSNTDN